jgi:hypothetical protein
MNRDPDEQLRQRLFDGWEIVGFQHVMAINGRTSDYSILLRSGGNLALYRVISDGERLYSSKIYSLTGEVS